MPMYILIAVGASLLVLFLSLESTITPLLFMLGLDVYKRQGGTSSGDSLRRLAICTFSSWQRLLMICTFCRAT